MSGSRLHHWLPTPPTGTQLRRDAVPSLCPLLLRVTVSRSCVVVHHPNGVSLPLLMVASVWRTSQNAVSTKFAELTFHALG
jgi:hypothetical protein